MSRIAVTCAVNIGQCKVHRTKMSEECSHFGSEHSVDWLVGDRSGRLISSIMEKATARYLFSEMPYAFAISSTWTASRCSFCLSNVESDDRTSCDGGCRTARYCDESCRENDQPLHEFECEAMRKPDVKLYQNNDIAVRILGRMISRYWLDKGVASLSIDFPNQFAQKRQLDDLMTHKKDIRRSKPHMSYYQRTKEAFYGYFQDTRLASVPESTLFIFFCRYVINGFLVMLRITPEPGYAETMGEAVYLNASRLDHSCKPTCLYRFDGVRLLIEYIGDRSEDEIDRSSNPPQLTKRDFDSLTIQYGFGKFYTHGVACPLTKQRISSLQRRYFFNCRCVLCSDATENEIQCHAAPVECSMCSWPYVWRKSKLFWAKTLKKSCRCKSEKETKAKEMEKVPWLLDKNAPKRVKELSRQWKLVMAMDTKKAQLNNLAATCISLVQEAEKFWSPKYNLRYAHLNEKLLDALGVETADDNVETCSIDKEDLDKMLKAGEAMLNVYSIYCQLYQSAVAKYAGDVAMLYKMRSDSPNDADFQRSKFWYGFAIDMWKRRGEVGCQKFMEEQEASPPPQKVD